MNKSNNAMGIFGGNIRAIREVKGKSCQSFAKDITYHRLDLANLEYGEKDIKLSTAVKIAKRLDIPLPYLFSDIFISGYLPMNSKRRPTYTEDDFLAVFIQNVKEYLGTRGSQETLCIETGMDSSNVSKILNYKIKNPCISTLDKMANGIGKDLSALLSRTEQMSLREQEGEK